MKILKTYKAVCTACKKDREYMQTETDLGFRDIAVSRWCACDPKLIVNSINPHRLSEVDTDPSEGGTV